MSQTTVSSSGQSIGVAGQVADSRDVRDIVSGFSQELTAQIPFGFGLMKGTTPNGYFLPTGPSGSMEVAGINTFGLNHARAGSVDSGGNFSGDMGASGLLPKSSMQVMVAGRVLVPVEVNVLNGDRPYCRVVATGALSQGAWLGSGMGGSYVRDCTAQGIFRSNTFTAADGVTKVAILEVDFTAKPA